MTTKNSILLIIKQSPGIDYNSLLNKLAQEYGSVNSARAALSRALKDLSALGMIERKENYVYVTEKGASLIESEMKNKLLLKLNNLVQGKNALFEINTIVEYLHALLEHSKKDSGLLKAARGSAAFSISDLIALNEKVQQQCKHLTHMSTVLSEQIEAIKGFDFNDAVKMPCNDSALESAQRLASAANLQEMLLESNDSAFLEKTALSLNQKIKGTALAVPALNFRETIKEIKALCAYPKPNTYTFYLTPFKLVLSSDSAVFSGPYSKLKEILEKK